VAAPKEPLGKLLVGAGLLTEDALADALAEHERSGRPLGEIVVQRGYAPATAVAGMLDVQRTGVVVPHGRSPRRDALERLTNAVGLVGVHADDPDARTTIAEEVGAALTDYEAQLDQELSPRSADETTLAEREERIAELEEDLRRLAAARDGALASLAAADRTQADLEQALADQAQRAERAEREQHIATLEARLEQLPRLEEELSRASASRDEALASLATVTAFAAARADEVREAKAALAERAAEAAELRSRLEDEAERRARADGMLAERDERVAALEASLETLTAARDEAVAALAALSAFAGTRAEDFERAQAELAVRTEQAAELRQRLEEEVERRSRSEGALAERDDIEEVVARLAQVHAERDEAHAARKLERAAEQLRVAEERQAESAARLEAAEAVRLELAAELESARAALAEPRPAPPQPAPTQVTPTEDEPAAHTLFVPTGNRYLLVERPGPPPAADDVIELELEGSPGRFRVVRAGRGPLPGSPACAYLEPS
jgi:chromosome segregation ATPase